MDNNVHLSDLEIEQENSKNVKKSTLSSEKLYSFEDAVALSGTGKYHYFLFLISGFCLMNIFVENLCVGITMPLIKCELQTTITQESGLASANFIGILLSSHAMGFLADTWGRLKTLRLSLIFCFITTVISAFSTNMWMLILFRLINGIFVSGLQAGIYNFLGEFHGQKTRVLHITLLSVFIALTSVFLPSIAMGILTMKSNLRILGLDLKPWRVYLLTTSTLSLFNICGLCLTPETPRFDLINGNHEKALRSLKKMFRINTGRPESEYPVKNICMDASSSTLNCQGGLKQILLMVWQQSAKLFSEGRAWHTINIFSTMFITNLFSQGTMIWFPTIIHELVAKIGQHITVCQVMSKADSNKNRGTKSIDSCNRPVDMEELSIQLMVGVAFSILYVMQVGIIQIIGQKRQLISFLVILAGSALALNWTSSFYITVVLLALVISIGIFTGVATTIALEYYPTNISGTAMCLALLMCSLGAAGGGYIIGPALLSNCTLLFYTFFISIVFVIIQTIFLPFTNVNKTCY